MTTTQIYIKDLKQILSELFYYIGNDKPIEDEAEELLEIGNILKGTVSEIDPKIVWRWSNNKEMLADRKVTILELQNLIANYIHTLITKWEQRSKTYVPLKYIRMKQSITNTLLKVSDEETETEQERQLGLIRKNIRPLTKYIPKYINGEKWQGYSPLVADYKNLTQYDKYLLYENFVELANYVFWCIGLPQLTKVQTTICEYLQMSLSDPNIIIEQFRGIGKSLITSIFVMWLLLRDRDLKILVISGSSEKAVNFVRFCYLFMQKVPLLKQLEIPTKAGERTSFKAFDVYGASPSQDPSVRSLGILGTVTSTRANIIIVDDAETKKNSRTIGGRQLLLEITTEFEALLIAGALQGIIYLGTRHAKDSLYHHIREERGYKHYICPVLYPKNKKEVEEYKGLLAPHIYADIEKYNCYGLNTDDRFDLDEVEQKKRGMGLTAFNMQMMLRVENSSSYYPLSLNDVLITPLTPSIGYIDLWINNENKTDIEVYGKRNDDIVHAYNHIGKKKKLDYCLMSIDPSGRGSDLFAYSVIGAVQGRLFLYECDGLAGGYKDENLYYLLDRARYWGVNHIVIEDNFGDGAITLLFKKAMIEKHISLSVTEVKNMTNKIDRIISVLEPIFNQHKIIFNTKVIADNNRIYTDVGHEHSFILQLSNISVGELEHDDLLDSFAIGVKEILQNLGLSSDTILQEEVEKEFYKLRLLNRNIS